MDANSRKVSDDLSEKLNQVYSASDIIQRENEQKNKQAHKQNGAILSRNNNCYNKEANTFLGRKSTMIHKKARVSEYGNIAKLTDEQKEALKILESGQNVFLSGEAGTGKTYVLNQFIANNRNKNIIICAPTGIAAINIGGSTIHRVFNVPIGVKRPGEYTISPSEALIKADVIVIDEISMCRFDLFEYVVTTIRRADQLKQHKISSEAYQKGNEVEIIKPKQIILVGDFYQLPPVLSEEDKKVLQKFWNKDESEIGNGFAFQSKLWKELKLNNIILTKIMRQKGDTDFICNLNKIRIGDPSGIDWLNENSSAFEIADGIFLCPTNKQVKEINDAKSDSIKGKSKIYEAIASGQLSNADKATDDNLQLKIGLQVMTLVNDVKGRYQNGTIGKIISMSDNSVQVMLKSGEVVEIEPYTWEVIGYEVQDDKVEKIVLGTFQQLPLKIAYAITIHKSQGQTYASANINPDCFAIGQLYVALSRVQEVNNIFLQKNICKRSLITSNDVKKFYSML